jgi:hypothetical protein
VFWRGIVTEGSRSRRAIGRMNARVASRLTWSMCVLCSGMAILGVLLFASLGRSSDDAIVEQWLDEVMVSVVFSPVLAVVPVLTFSVVGAVIVSRLPGNLIGWIFCSIGFLGGIRLLGTEYAAYSLLVTSGSLPGGRILAWLDCWLWVPDVALYLFLALLFPNGRLPSARWRPLAWFTVVVAAMGTVAVALSPGPIRGLEPVDNPLGLAGFPRAAIPTEILLYASGLVAALSVLLRLRRSEGDEREQIKWFAYAGVLLAISTAVTYVLYEATGPSWVEWVVFVPALIGITGMPVGVGIAILRYRLYDIDIIISRSLVYGSLTLAIAAIFEAADAVMHYLLLTLTHQEESVVSVIVAALVIAALFDPVKHRIKRLVDSRIFGEDEPSRPGGQKPESK